MIITNEQLKEFSQLNCSPLNAIAAELLKGLAVSDSKIIGELKRELAAANARIAEMGTTCATVDHYQAMVTTAEARAERAERMVEVMAEQIAVYCVERAGHFAGDTAARMFGDLIRGGYYRRPITEANETKGSAVK